MKTCKLLLIFLLSFLLFGCGGGGGGSDSNGDGDVTPSATLNAQSGQAIAGMSLSMRQMTDSFEDTSPVGFLSSPSDTQTARSSLISHMLGLIRNQVIQNDGQIRPMGSISNHNTPCGNGGSITLDASWDGPQNMNDCSQVSDFQGVLDVNACQQMGVFIDGTATFGIGGNLCAPTSISLGYDEWTMQVDNPAAGFTFTNLSLRATNLQYSGDDITRMTMTFNGSMDASADGEAYSAGFNNYSITVDATNSTETSLSFSGAFRGSCLDGWVTIETLEPIVIPDGQVCPTSGQLRITGNGTMLITFNSDGSVDVGDTHYASCHDVSSECN